MQEGIAAMATKFTKFPVLILRIFTLMFLIASLAIMHADRVTFTMDGQKYKIKTIGTYRYIEYYSKF